MIKVLERAIEKIKALSEERQEYVAQVLEQIAAGGEATYALSDDELRLVRKGLVELDRGEAASEAGVRAVFDKYRA
jgi:hypothetical protein